MYKGYPRDTQGIPKGPTPSQHHPPTGVPRSNRAQDRLPAARFPGVAKHHESWANLPGPNYSGNPESRLSTRLTPRLAQSRVNLLQGSQPVVPLCGTRRLRVLRGSAADPLNLLQVMLAKGIPRVFPPACSRRNASEVYAVTVD